MRLQKALNPLRTCIVFTLITAYDFLVKQAGGLRREINLSGALAFDFRQLGELAVDRLLDRHHGAADGLDQVRGQAVLVIKQ